MKRSSLRIAPLPRVNKMRATVYIYGELSLPGATEPFFVEFVKQNKPLIAGRGKRILHGRFPHFGAKRLPMRPKINGAPAPLFESRKTIRKMAKTNAEISPNCRREYRALSLQFSTQMGRWGGFRKSH